MSKKPQLAAPSTATPLKAAAEYPLEVFSLGLPQDVTFCTMPCGTVEEAGRVMRHIETAQERLWDMRETTIEVRHIIVAASEEEDNETGEVREVRRLILINKEGFGCQTPSAAARRSLYRQLTRLAKAPFHRLPPYDPPLRIYVKEEKSTDKNKGPWLHLIVQEGDGTDSKESPQVPGMPKDMV